MKIFAVLLFLFLIVLGCKSQDEFKKHEPKKGAVELNKEAMKIAMFEEEYNEKVDSAIILLQQAIDLDSLYIEPRLNIIRFAYLKNDIELALQNCHDLQSFHPTSPMFLVLEGMILESEHQKEKATTLYKKALDLFESDLYDELDENPNLEIEYIQCLVLNNQKEKAKTRLENLKANNKENHFYDGLTIDDLMEGYYELINDHNRN